jgi:hypothetical protein
MRLLVFLFVTLFFISCGNQNTEPQTKTVANEELIFYTPSEMAQLMEEMYVYNANLKEKILSNSELGEFNHKFETIHSANLKETFDRDALFENLSQALIVNQKAIYSTDKENVINQFNLMVNSCIACHKNTCTGPIPRIEKLLIR